MTTTKKRDILFITIAIVVGLSASLLIYSQYLVTQREIKEMSVVSQVRKPEEKNKDTVPEILEEIDKTELENLENQFEEIDTDLNAL